MYQTLREEQIHMPANPAAATGKPVADAGQGPRIFL
jgi:hypothetical protein